MSPETNILDLPKSVPTHVANLLPDVFTASDKTIQEAHNQAVLTVTAAPATGRPPKSARNNGNLATTTIDPVVMAEARRLAGGNLARITLRPDGTILVR